MTGAMRKGPFAVTAFALSILLIGCGVGAADPEVESSDWVADAVFYQIFPERFSNGDKTNDPPRSSLEYPEFVPTSWEISSWTADWYARAAWEREMSDDFYGSVYRRRYGGDLQGVLDRLDYLADLGVTAIYFNPLFYARSLHKYDGNTYHHIDPYFGPDPDGDLEIIRSETSDPSTWTWTSADRLLLTLLEEARSRGIRIVIDGVWNHTGRDFFAFADLRERQQESAYRDWYIVKSFDDPATAENEFDYQGWWGSRQLPEFADTQDGTDLHPGPKRYVYDSTRRWMDPDGDGDPSDGVDGWRLDVVPDMPVGFWKDWNAYVREINPEIYTTSEIWHDASETLVEAGFSATMNYHAFAIPVKAFLIDRMVAAPEFSRLLEQRGTRYPFETRLRLQNLIDSHDTPRLASMIVNPRDSYTDPEWFDYDRHSGPRSTPDFDLRRPSKDERKIQRLVALLQMTYVGPPMIYYGSESGMWGADDPDDRMPMVWPELEYEVQREHPLGRPREADSVRFDTDLHAFYRDAIALRRNALAFRRGTLEFVDLSSSDGTFGFVRKVGPEAVIVLLNRDDSAHDVVVETPIEWEGTEPKLLLATVNHAASHVSTDIETGEVEVHLPSLSGVVLGASR